MSAPTTTAEATTRDEALGATEVTKRYFDGDAKVIAVDSVTLKVARGELVVLRGSSGSGKTTLLGLLGGLVAPTKGDVRIAGKSVVHLRDHHRTQWRRKHVGFVFQELQLVRGMSLIENVLLPFAPSGGAGKDDVARADGLLDRFGLKAKRNVRVEKLSGGERQRGALARGLVLEPEVLLLDEPTAHVDADNASRILDLLAEEKSRGRAVLATTHDPRLSEDARVDRVLSMSAGRLAP
ncbi:MAG: ATP-binding cassette domain-containing protein [Sandaracinus sp.]|nr:ATP-binding cassette domain-containing protein [Myxococcales bacterium]MCB9611181.1 ATP-binding cassette domain-containing protein [Sandaracinus sp.]MCB9630893.1 ATP-binding cassette domain-containing protein [Sandaracinus sp.]